MEENKVMRINLIDVFKLLKADKKNMLIYLFVGAIIGTIVAFSIPKVYKTTVILAPEETNNGFSGSLTSLASMVGMNMKIGDSGDAIYPEIYPDVMGSTDFLVSLFSVQVTTKDRSYTADYATYLKEKTDTPWWNFPRKWIAETIKRVKGDSEVFTADKKVDPKNLTKTEWELTKDISNKLNCSVDKKTNVITITVEDQDPAISACIADTVTNQLQVLITDYRTKKARNDVQYLEKIFEESKKQFVCSQREYSFYYDSHKKSRLKTVNQEGERLKSEMQLRENIYNTIAQQLQLAKAKVQEDTPAFTTIQGASAPVKHSNKPKIFILAIWTLLAFLVRCFILAWKNKEMFITDATC